MDSIKKQDSKTRITMDKKGFQQSGAVGIPKVEKRQTTKMIGFSLSSGRKRKPEENEKKYEPTPKVVKKTVKQTSTKPPLREISKTNNLPKPKVEIKRKTSVLPNRIQLKKEITETPKPRVPKVLTEKSLNTMTSFSLKKLILEQQDTLKNLNKQIKALTETVEILKEEKQKIVIKEDDIIMMEKESNVVAETVEEVKPIESNVQLQSESETIIEEPKAPVEEAIEIVPSEEVKAPVEEKPIEAVADEIPSEDPEVVADEVKKSESKEIQIDALIEEIAAIQQTTAIERKVESPKEINQNVDDDVVPQISMKEVEVEDKKRVNDIIQSIMEENEKIDSPIQRFAPKQIAVVDEEEEYEEPTTIELSKVLNFDDCEVKNIASTEEDEHEISIAKKTPVRKRNLRKKRKSVDNLENE